MQVLTQLELNRVAGGAAAKKPKPPAQCQAPSPSIELGGWFKIKIPKLW